jgi:hypothetical protein
MAGAAKRRRHNITTVRSVQTTRSSISGAVNPATATRTAVGLLNGLVAIAIVLGVFP